MKRYVLSTLVLLCFSCDKDKACEEGHRSIEIVNQSDRQINFNFYWNYPDTTIGEYNPLNDGTGGFGKNQSRTRPFSTHRKGCVETAFANGRKEWIYIFDQDSLKKLDWELIRQTNSGLLERRMIDLEYLRANDYKVVYP